MSIDIRWEDNDQTLLRVMLASPWDWPDLEYAMSQSLEMITPVGHTVHFLIDFANQGRRPKGNSLMYLKRVMQRVTKHPLAGESYLINPNPFARSLIDTVLRVYKEAQHIHLVGSQEEALRCIEALAQEGVPGD
jgi:hypothetical protein